MNRRHAGAWSCAPVLVFSLIWAPATGAAGAVPDEPSPHRVASSETDEMVRDVKDVATASTSRVAGEVTAVPPVAPACVGTGADGARVHVVYAHEAGRADRFAAVSGDIRDEIARIDAVFEASAQKRVGIDGCAGPRTTACPPSPE